VCAARIVICATLEEISATPVETVLKTRETPLESAVTFATLETVEKVLARPLRSVGAEVAIVVKTLETLLVRELETLETALMVREILRESVERLVAVAIVEKTLRVARPITEEDRAVEVAV
jgi:hypothetical protein